MVFETNLNDEGARQLTIGICGVTGCTLPDDLDTFFSRLKKLTNVQNMIAVQLFDSNTIATHLHLLVSTLYALRAFETSKNISNTVGTEILLYASAQHQIVDAIDKVGVKPGSSNVAAVVISHQKDAMRQTMLRIVKELSGQMDDSALSISTQDKANVIRAVFGITERELDSARTELDPKNVEWPITKRVLSRISMMAISK